MTKIHTLLDQSAIEHALTITHKQYLKEIIVLNQVGSTNDYLLDYAARYPAMNCACLAEQQTAGRGRLGRKWSSPFGCNIYLSLLWWFKNPTQTLLGLSLMISVAIVEALELYGLPIGLQVKWPNDVLWQGAKLAGTLLELYTQSADVSSPQRAVVIGIGLNVNMRQSETLDLPYAWTDVATIIGHDADRNEIAGLLLERLITNLNLFEGQDFSYWHSRWEMLDITRGLFVNVITPNEVFEGFAGGVNQTGEFLLHLENGERLRFTTGEVSIRVASR